MWPHFPWNTPEKWVFLCPFLRGSQDPCLQRTHGSERETGLHNYKYNWVTYVYTRTGVMLRKPSWKVGGDSWLLDRVLRMGRHFSDRQFIEECFRQRRQHLQSQREVEFWVRDKYAPLNIVRVVCRVKVGLADIHKASGIIFVWKQDYFKGSLEGSFSKVYTLANLSGQALSPCLLIPEHMCFSSPPSVPSPSIPPPTCLSTGIPWFLQTVEL